MIVKQLNILLADDDMDDCSFFEEALKEFLLPTNFTAVHNGEQLMELLINDAYQLPHVIFLDLNMPRKNGFECLCEIKLNGKLKQVPVIIFSTSFEQEVVNRLYKNEAQYFIRKPTDFGQFKNIIDKALTIIAQENFLQPVREKFVLTLEESINI